MRHRQLGSLQPALSDSAVRVVFGAIAASLLEKASPEAQELRGSLVAASLALLRELQRVLPATQATPQMQLGLRDLSRMWEGMWGASPRCTDQVSRFCTAIHLASRRPLVLRSGIAPFSA